VKGASKYLGLFLVVLLAACITRFWLIQLPTSFWVDEMVTAFVVHYGPSHPSLAVAPQVTETVYYSLPKVAEALFGFSEVVYRIPSLIAVGLALFLIAHLAMRLIHPQAGWFAAFACLSLAGFNYEAADARPYGLGTAVFAAALLFLVRWLDTSRWRNGFVFAACAALLWRVHLIYWPFYAIFAAFALWRLATRDTPVTWARAALIFALFGAVLVPVALRALALGREAHAHVIIPLPKLRDLRQSYHFLLVAICAAGTWLIGRFSGWPRETKALRSGATVVLILGWWLWHPLALFVYSWLTRNSVFVPRYLSLELPGTALAATLAAATFVPSNAWKPLAAVLGAGVLLFVGGWKNLHPRHDNSNWRQASKQIDSLKLSPGTPVIYPSPFIEAKPPVWRPDYPLPGFLYCHLLVYPVAGKPYLFPFERSPEADEYASVLSARTLSSASRFLIYGGDRNVLTWRDWFEQREEFTGWQSKRLGPFGDVDVVVFENSAAADLAGNLK
jgi:hypothetical protein